ncbi:MAG: DUF1924 domain-containing protein [Rubrivivax sp.]|mgnify:CR=1 FL=1
MNHSRCKPAALCAALALLATAPAARALSATELLAEYTKAAGAASVERGQKFFATNFGKTLGFSCASCHGEQPTRSGRDQVTEKPIAPLAPAANPQRFTDRARVDHMFRLNCRDVVGRDCTAQEKADVLAWLVSLRP